MEKYFISWGLGGGFGGANNHDIIEADSLEEAENVAFESAVEEYDNMAGLHGLRTVFEIMDEDGVDEDEAIEIYVEEFESWIEYGAELYNPEKHDDLL
jgi:hypothetical protein